MSDDDSRDPRWMQEKRGKAKERFNLHGNPEELKRAKAEAPKPADVSNEIKRHKHTPTLTPSGQIRRDGERIVRENERGKRDREYVRRKVKQDRLERRTLSEKFRGPSR